MSQRIDQFSETIRKKLAEADGKLSVLKAKVDAKDENAEREVRAHFDAVTKRVDEGKGKASAAQAEIAKWMEQRKAATSAAVADWKAKGEAAKLRTRAESAERYASATIDVASSAVDAAEQAALEAWLARHDAEHHHGKSSK